MTEEEAKTKWCPFARVVFPGGTLPAGNRAVGQDGQEGSKGSRCIASACMAWRVTPPKSLTSARIYAENGEKINAIKALREVFGDLDLLTAKQIVEGARPWPAAPAPGGYCGLAGAPQ